MSELPNELAAYVDELKVQPFCQQFAVEG